MDKNMMHKTIRISVISSLIIFILLCALTNTSEEIDFISYMSKTVTIIMVFWVLYFNYGWKIKWFDKIYKIPNLNGTWIGYLESDWIDENGNGIDAIEFYIVIKQSFFNINIKTFTESYVGKSYIEKIDFNEKEEEMKLAYFYCSDIISSEEDKRQGVAELRVFEDTLFLKGKYWTRNKTCGAITVRFHNRKRYSTYEEIKSHLNN
ncbi:hypothetical protein [Paenibacillus sp. KS-LC4]|uniref:Cap15 family cyclic dinucleotide receptor domain-containing protein n=1 Tax=Paenibacillus sp. KS-LC4 TaxID=2979727 RepID=UPI0030CD0E34